MIKVILPLVIIALLLVGANISKDLRRCDVCKGILLEDPHEYHDRAICPSCDDIIEDSLTGSDRVIPTYEEMYIEIDRLVKKLAIPK